MRQNSEHPQNPTVCVNLVAQHNNERKATEEKQASNTRNKKKTSYNQALRKINNKISRKALKYVFDFVD